MKNLPNFEEFKNKEEKIYKDEADAENLKYHEDIAKALWNNDFEMKTEEDIEKEKKKILLKLLDNNINDNEMMSNGFTYASDYFMDFFEIKKPEKKVKKKISKNKEDRIFDEDDRIGLLCTVSIFSWSIFFLLLLADFFSIVAISTATICTLLPLIYIIRFKILAPNKSIKENVLKIKQNKKDKKENFKKEVMEIWKNNIENNYK